MRQDVAQSVFKSSATRVFLTQVVIAGVVGSSSYVPAKVSDGSLLAVVPNMTQSGDKVGNDVVEQVTRVLS